MSTPVEFHAKGIIDGFQSTCHLGYVCGRCSALVADVGIHLTWHSQIEPGKAFTWANPPKPPKPSPWDTATIGEKWARDFLGMPPDPAT